MPHVHVGAVEGLKIAATLIIVGALWRVMSAQLSDRPLGQAMAFIY